MKRVYISKSIHIDDYGEYFNSALNYLRSIDVDYSFWKKGCTYVSSVLNSSDAIVLLANIDSRKGFMGRGSFEELCKAKNQGKPIYLLYRLVDSDTWQLYHMTFFQFSDSDYNKWGQYHFGTNITKNFIRLFSNNDKPASYKKWHEPKITIQDGGVKLLNINRLILRRRK